MLNLSTRWNLKAKFDIKFFFLFFTKSSSDEIEILTINSTIQIQQ